MAQPKHISIGRLGEKIVCGFLSNRGYLIVERNYRKKCGELDIVAKKDGVLHFVEVKAGSWSGRVWPQRGADIHRPEDHMHVHKRERLARTVEMYRIGKRLPPEQVWTIDLAVVYINKDTRKARVSWVWDVTL